LQTGGGDGKYWGIGGVPISFLRLFKIPKIYSPLGELFLGTLMRLSWSTCSLLDIRKAVKTHQTTRRMAILNQMRYFRIWKIKYYDLYDYIYTQKN